MPEDTRSALEQLHDQEFARALMAAADKGNKAIDNEIADRLEAAGADEEVQVPSEKNEAGFVKFSIHKVRPGALMLVSEVEGLDPIDALSVALEGCHQYLDEVRKYATPAFRLASNLHRVAGDKHKQVAQEVLDAILEIGKRNGLGDLVESVVEAEKVMRDLEDAKVS